MVDITMCKGTDCLFKENCYRFKAAANPHRQSYFMKPPFKLVKNEEGSEQEVLKCDYFCEE